MGSAVAVGDLNESLAGATPSIQHGLEAVKFHLFERFVTVFNHAPWLLFDNACFVLTSFFA